MESMTPRLAQRKNMKTIEQQVLKRQRFELEISNRDSDDESSESTLSAETPPKAAREKSSKEKKKGIE